LSYDLTLFRPVEGVDPNLTYQNVVEQDAREASDLDQHLKRAIPDLARAQMQRVADVLRSRHSAFAQFEPDSAVPWIELNDEGLQVQVNISERTVGITLPYFRKDAGDMIGCVRKCIEVLNQEAGYVAYDPQLDRFVSKADFDEMVTAYRRMDRALPEIIERKTLGSGKPKKPWWKIW
jgi:hypothetical protein